MRFERRAKVQPKAEETPGARQDAQDPISPVFATDARIIVANKSENPINLCCHNWLTDHEMVPWNQAQVRADFPGTDKTALRVSEAGKYRLTLRRRPALSLEARLLPSSLPPWSNR